MSIPVSWILAKRPDCGYTLSSPGPRGLCRQRRTSAAAARKGSPCGSIVQCCLQLNRVGYALPWETKRVGVGAEPVVRLEAPRCGDGPWAEVAQPATILRRSVKAERRQSRLASKPSAFCWLSASGIAPIRVWLTMNVHPACLIVNTFSSFSEIASLAPPGVGMTTWFALVSDLHVNSAATA